MPGKFKRNEYDLVDEAHDGKIPVHNEDAFEHGLRYKVKVRQRVMFSDQRLPMFRTWLLHCLPSNWHCGTS